MSLITRSLPPREAWIEITRPLAVFLSLTSLPPREAWIEIGHHLLAEGRSTGRFPHGKRGLKYPEREALREALVSLPPREAWIEIFPTPWPIR